MTFVGTSGWHYKHWIGPFYPKRMPASQMLEWYAQRFDTVEINNTFYRLPPEGAVENWRDSVPGGFRFAVKGSRFITHMKKLKDPVPALAKFFERADRLGRKIGPVVFQLPPYWPLDLPRLAAFLEALPRRHRYAFEFRNDTWNVKEVHQLLRKHRAAFCMFHLAGAVSPYEITTDFSYIRLHGPGGKYQGLYSSADLQQWAARIREWQLKKNWIYFDNDDSGFAPENAAALRAILDHDG